MHSHVGLQEQNLLAAPLIIREMSAIAAGLQEIVMMVEDFSWRTPGQIFADLRKPGPMAAMPMPSMPASGGMDLNDVTYDAFLANDRTLADPQVFDVERGAEVRLRLINGAASTNFWIDLGALEGTLIAVDGNPVQPVKGRLFPLAIAQRADIVVRVPADAGALPVLARGEGLARQAGIVLRPRGATVAKLPAMADRATPALGLVEEMALRAVQPLSPRAADQTVPVDLTGAMVGYIWGMTVHGLESLPVTVDKGQRVVLAMRNTTMMAHPMHLHGHSFQVVGVDDRTFPGAIRDTVLVPPKTTVRVAFDADNPGPWAFHCHNLYHLAAGMFATVVYRGFT
jgi:FtsP/CotA-like multicopper oxidase with cupredoxin domain